MVTSRNPVPWFSLAEDDGVEQAIWALDAHRSSTVLIEVVDLQPDLQCFSFEVEREVFTQQIRLLQRYGSLIKSDFAM